MQLSPRGEDSSVERKSLVRDLRFAERSCLACARNIADPAADDSQAHRAKLGDGVRGGGHMLGHGGGGACADGLQGNGNRQALGKAENE